MAAGVNPISVKRGIDKAVELVVDELKNLSKPTNTAKHNLREIVGVLRLADVFEFVSDAMFECIRE